MTNFLIYAAIILGIAALSMLARVFELASELKGSKSWQVKESDNRLNGYLMLLFMIAFFIFCIWQFVEYKDRMLPISASEHGVEIDWLFNFNMVIITIVFFITNGLLFYFAYKYYGRDGAVATFFPHNNKLELLWTSVPAVVLAFIIVLGLQSWNKITDAAPENATVIELYAKQFSWTARLSGTDNQLGKSNYRLIDGTNELGMDSTDEKGWDDAVVRNELHLLKGQPVEFKIHARDVIHSMYMPHFRAQINAVPGMTTAFHFTPIITTDSMRLVTKNPKFDYILLCNKICGASHYNMQMTIVVDEPAQYQEWLKKQKAFFNNKTAMAAPAAAPAVETKVNEEKKG